MNLTTAGPSALPLVVNYPDSVAFMYSGQPVTVRALSAVPALQVTVTLMHDASGASHTETRLFRGGRVDFDLGRTMQLLAPDVDEAFSNYDRSASGLAQAFTAFLSYTDTDGVSYPIATVSTLAMYGALDQGEEYGAPEQKRLWVNFPQTFAIWRNFAGGAFGFNVNGTAVRPDSYEGAQMQEVNLQNVLKEEGEDALLAQLTGAPSTVELTWSLRIATSPAQVQNFRTLTLVPDARTRGTYLRWLNRRGEISYWLFENSQLRTATTVRNAFRRHYEGNLTDPSYGSLRNPQKADYREAREMTLGAVGVSREEYDELCDLFVSPVIERLMPDGATWQRVNVAAGTYARSIKRDTPRLQDVEIVIELPERNTVKL